LTGLPSQITHASAGVEKGLKSGNALPIEVMGLMQGHVDTEEAGTIIVTDVRDHIVARVRARNKRRPVDEESVMAPGVDNSGASIAPLSRRALARRRWHVSCSSLPPQVFPLPVEGTETSVMSDNPEVTNYMIRLSDSLESVRGGGGVRQSYVVV